MFLDRDGVINAKREDDDYVATGASSAFCPTSGIGSGCSMRYSRGTPGIFFAQRYLGGGILVLVLGEDLNLNVVALDCCRRSVQT